MLGVLILCIVVKVVIEVRVIDSVYVDMAMGLEEWCPKKGIMPLGIDSMDGIEILWLIAGFRDGQGLFDPIYSGVHGMEPRESEDDIFSSTAHDVEKMFLSDPFDICIKGASVAGCTSLICSLVHVVNGDRRGEFNGEKVVFPDKLPVNARDIYTRVY